MLTTDEKLKQQVGSTYALLYVLYKFGLNIEPYLSGVPNFVLRSKT